MSDFEPFGYRLNDADAMRADTLTRLQSDNFNAITRHLNLDIRYDFVATDLSYVDFTDCDLRGHDFTKVDLSHTFGTGVVMDQTTILDFCLVTNSIFRPISLRRKIINRYDLGTEISNLRSLRWDKQILYFSEPVKSKIDAMKMNDIAQSILEFSDDAAVRSTLYKRVEQLIGKKAAMEYYRSVIATEGRSSLLIPTLRMYIEKLQNISERRRTLLPFALSNAPDLRTFAQSNLIDYVLEAEDIKWATPIYSKSSEKYLRQDYLKKAASVLGPKYETSILYRNSNVPIDFKEPITKDTLNQIFGELKPKNLFVEDRIEGVDFLSQIRKIYNDMIASEIPIKLQF